MATNVLFLLIESGNAYKKFLTGDIHAPTGTVI